MSQAGLLDVEGSNPQIPTSFVTDAGTAVPLLNILEILGTNGITTSGAGNTVTIDGSAISSGIESIGVDASTGPGTNPVLPTGPGMVTITGGQVASGVVGTNVIRTDSLAANTFTIEIQRSATSVATDITKNGVSHFNSADFSVDVNGFVSIVAGAGSINSFIPDSGTSPVVPTGGGQVTMAGSGSITTVGGANTLTTQLTGLTNHAVLVGAGTTTITKVGPTATIGQVLQSAGAAADPAFSTATYPLTTTINELLFSSAANTVTGLATANRAVLTTGATGVPVMTALATDGQLIIGSTAGVPTAATLTAGTGISITNGSNSITIASTAGAFTWSDQSGAFSPLAQNGYFITGTATGTLPASPAQGDTIQFFVDHASQLLTIDAPGTQIIRFGNQVSSAGGTFVSTAQGDSAELVYRSSDTCWCAVDYIGTWTFT